MISRLLGRQRPSAAERKQDSRHIDQALRWPETRTSSLCKKKFLKENLDPNGLPCSFDSEVKVGGGLAEYVGARETLTVARPADVSGAEGTTLPIAGLTAHQTLTRACGIKLNGTGETKNILITAASGGVGHYAVQLAKLGNTHVS